LCLRTPSRPPATGSGQSISCSLHCGVVPAASEMPGVPPGRRVLEFGPCDGFILISSFAAVPDAASLRVVPYSTRTETTWETRSRVRSYRFSCRTHPDRRVPGAPSAPAGSAARAGTAHGGTGYRRRSFPRPGSGTRSAVCRNQANQDNDTQRRALSSDFLRPCNFSSPM
jgi:hypothetical protein